MPLAHEPDPNVFRGYIATDDVAARMVEVVQRGTYLSSADRFLAARRVPMREFRGLAPHITREHVESLICGLMVGPGIRDSFNEASQVVLVERKENVPYGVALLNVPPEGPYGPDGDTVYEPGVHILAYGSVMDAAGAVNYKVMQLLAQKSGDFAHEVSSGQSNLHGTFYNPDFTQTVYLTASHSAIPTVLADAVHSRLTEVIRCLNGIVANRVQMGAGFPEKVYALDAAATDLQKSLPEHPFVKAFEESQARQTLRSLHVQFGGDENTYRRIQKTAGTVLTFFTALMRGMQQAFVQLHPPSPLKPPVSMESTESPAGDVSVRMHHVFNVSSAHFMSQAAGQNPVIRFETDRPDSVSTLTAELWKKVSQGEWWQKRMSADA